jgi:ATP-binding protein involved in chromosome partitioning
MPPMAPTEAAIREAMRGVIDPELRRDVVELGMLGPIEIRGGDVEIEIVLTVPGCPLRQNLEGQVRHHASQVDGVQQVAVRFSHMDDAQRAALRQRIGGAKPEGKGLSVPESTRVIAVASGKGGVGKSSLSVNLALALRGLGREVGIVDADIYGWSVPGMLGVNQRPISLDGMIVPPVAHDLRVMSIGFFLEQEGGAIIWRGPMLHRALEQFLSDVHWGELDYLVVDMPPGTGDVGLSLGQLLPRAEAVVVTTPQAAAQRVAERAAAMVRKVGQNLVGVVENMSPYPCPCCGELTAPFGSGGGARLAGTLGVPLLGEVPLDPELREGADEGAPVVLESPGSPSALAIAQVAAALDGMRPARPVRIASPLTVLQQ